MKESESKQIGRRQGQVFRIALLVVAWGVLTAGALIAGDLTVWIVGVPAIVLAGILSLRLASPRVVSFSGMAIARFIPFFFAHALSGGVDVARRVFLPSLPIEPVFVPYRTRLPEDGVGVIFFVNIINLLPGTICAEIDGKTLWIHAIDGQSSFGENLKALEDLVGAIFRELPASLKTDGEGA